MFVLARMTLCLAVAGILYVAPVSAQNESRKTQPPASQYYYNPLEQSIQWLRNEQIQKEIELTGDQAKKLDEIRRDYYARTQQMYKDLRGVAGGQRYEKLHDMRRKLAKDVEARVRKVLLPQQVDRLRQIMLQMALLRQGSSRTLLVDQVAEELKITESQKAKLQATENQARREMQEKIRKHQEKLRAEMLEKILSELDAAQRAKLEKMMGAPFELSPKR
jgi:Spy/CpxP family protein refolding chaperone